MCAMHIDVESGCCLSCMENVQAVHTLGHEFLLTLYLWYALPAFSIGFSVLPPPDTCPTVARQVLGIICSNSDHTLQGSTTKRITPSAHNEQQQKAQQAQA